jgi:hypothetical protein
MPLKLLIIQQLTSIGDLWEDSNIYQMVSSILMITYVDLKQMIGFNIMRKTISIELNPQLIKEYKSYVPM